MLKVPQRGSIHWIKLSDVLSDEEKAKLGDVEVGIKYVGRAEANKWSLLMQRVRFDEMKRLHALRAELKSKGVSKEEVPELFGDASSIVTPDGFEELMKASSLILKECIGGIKGVEGYEDEKDKSKIAELVEELGVTQFLIPKIIELQSPTKTENLSSGS